MMARFIAMVPVTSRRSVILLLVSTLLVGWLQAIGAIVMAQTAVNQAAIQDRLNRIGNELLSAPDKVRQAIEELKEILAADPRSAQAHLLLGIAYRVIGSPEFMGEATAELRQALALEPNFVPARFYLARLYLDLGRAARAREELEAALAQQPNHPQFLALLGEVERQLKSPGRSVQLNRQALQADPALGEARYYLGLALFDLGEREEGIRELERVVQSGTKQVELFSSLGAAYIEAGRLDEALAILGEATHLDPARPDLRIQLSRVYRSKGLLDKAGEQLKIASPAAIQSLASGFQQQEVEFELHQERGLLAIAQRRLAAAVDSFQKALTMDPDHGPTNRYLAEAYLLQGSYKLASDYSARAEKLGFPLSPDKRRLLEKRLPGKGSGKQQ